MDKALRDHIEYLLCVKVNAVRSLSGGDISTAYVLETDSERFFCKVNHKQTAFSMFEAEKKGLEAIAKTKTIAVPQFLLCEPLEKGGFLLMEYIEPKRATTNDLELLGHQLAALHGFSESNTFGWESYNFIGSLDQYNKKHTDWSKFYVGQRLLPQLKLAVDGKRLNLNEIPSGERLLKTCQNLFPTVKPSLLHGDLWGGNYLVSNENIPYLIDPAVYYGHHEVDLAMTRLFGGFGPSFYHAHETHFPEIGGEKERTDIYQLYYLLVHLNLFGSSYYNSVKAIFNHYF